MLPQSFSLPLAIYFLFWYMLPLRLVVSNVPPLYNLSLLSRSKAITDHRPSGRYGNESNLLHQEVFAHHRKGHPRQD